MLQISQGKVHVWPVISQSVTFGNFVPLLTLGLKSSKGERSLQDQTGMCNKSYSLMKICWLTCVFVSYLHYELMSHEGALFAATLPFHFKLVCPLHGPALSYFHLLLSVSHQPQWGYTVIPILLYQMASRLMETLCPLSVCGVVTRWVKENVCWQGEGWTPPKQQFCHG